MKTIIIIGTLLMVGVFANSFLEPNDDIKQLKAFTEELNIYAKNKYKEIDGACTDFTLRQESLTNEEITHSNLNIEMRDNVPVVSNGITAATLTKDDLNNMLNNVEEIKERIDAYISKCAKNENINKIDKFMEFYKTSFKGPSIIIIPNGERFKISSHEVVTIVDGNDNCENAGLDYKCTHINTLNNSKNIVTYLSDGKKKREYWTTKNTNWVIQLLRPNGEPIELINK